MSKLGALCVELLTADMDAHFDHEVPELPLLFFPEEWTDNFPVDAFNTGVDAFRVEPVGWMGLGSSADFAIGPISAEVETQSEHFDIEPLNTVPLDLDLGEGEVIGGQLSRPQHPTFTVDSLYTIQGSLPFRQQAGVCPFDNQIVDVAPVEQGQLNAMRDAVRSDPRQELYEW